jgi:hypothetical protein
MSKNQKKENQIEQTDESNVPIKIPFDPNLIRIKRDPFTLGELIDKIEHNEVNFLTDFQRKADLWNPVQQSRLIESVLLKLPLPAFYFDEIIKENEETNEKIYYWQVIDGLQRCSVLKKFAVDRTMKLEKMEFLERFNDSSYDDLPRELQRRISQTPITVYVVEKGTPDEVKFNIFKRINTGGLILTPQEIRHALNQGIPAKFVADLANLKQFKTATCNIIKPDRMEDRDFVTRFISFYLKPYTEYDPDLDSFMTKRMAELKYLNEEKRKIIKESFIQAMEIAVTVFGNDAFRKRKHKNDKRKPLNKALFETLSVTFAKLNLKNKEIFINRRKLFISKYINLNQSPSFENALSSGTGQKENVKKRFEEVNRIVNETITTTQ